MQTPSKTSQLGRPKTPRLSRKAIGRAALEMFQEEEGLSIPRLAERLGVRQSSFYKHVTGRQEIIELARGALVEKATLPEMAQGNLDQVIRQIFDSLLRAYSLVPALLPLLLAQPVSHPAALALYDRFAEAFERAGTPRNLVIPTLETLDSAAIGASLDAMTMESAWSISDEEQSDYPHLYAARTAVAEQPVDRFSFLADVLAAGLRSAIKAAD
ncbi:TetR/AcrR family transcriptional regulator [Arthrobacter sp. NyZ413]|uniref:TetR/AcrR family transcriptional regulator n=1 Tax=Arthrobacter sp. NyZ413 TaxID=3144669 RepID=UPI003BF7B873